MGLATPSDFWVFAGYARWGPQQLLGERERKSWYMVATDSQTLVEELLWQKPSALWQFLVQVTGRDALVLQETGSYDNCKFKE